MTAVLSEPRGAEFLDEFTLLLDRENEPMGFEAGDANLYRYVGNEPTNYVDPTGHLGLGPGYGVLPVPDPSVYYPPSGRGLSNAEKKALSPYIPQEDLDNARLHIGEIPWWVSSWAAGITLGNDIYIRDPNACFETPESLGLLGHELQHVGQYRKGMNVFKYIWDNRHGYDNSEYEREAYEKQAEIERGLQPQ